MAITIHYNPASQHGRRTRIAALELGLTDVQFEVVPFPSPKDYLAINPMGKVPTLVEGEFVLWESNAIMAYLAEQKGGALYGTDPRSRAEVNRWLFWESAHFGPACIGLTWERVMKPMFMKKPGDETLIAHAAHNFARFSKVLNETLATREYVTGKLSIADFAISCIAMYRQPAQFDTKAFPHVEAYLARMESRDSWKQTQPQF